MAGPNWSLLQIPDIGQTFLNGIQQGRAAKKEELGQNALTAYAQNPTPENLNALAPYHPEFTIQQRQLQQQQDRATAVGGSLATGDYTGAGNTALAAGDIETFKIVAGLEQAHREQVKAKVSAAGPVAIQARQASDPAQRAAIIQAASPTLLAAGWKPEEISAFVSDPNHLSDAGLDGFIASLRTTSDALAHYDKQNEPFTLGQDQQRFDGQGHLIAAGPESIKAVTTPADATTTILGGAGHTGVSGQKYTGGWTPRARNGGDNPDPVVDSKIAGAAKALGVDPGEDISALSPMRIAQAMTLSEGGAGSLADRNNNPGNLRNTDGSYKTFPSKQAGLAAVAALVARKLKNGQTTVQSLIEGLPTKGAGPMVIHGPKKADDTPMLSPEDVTYAAEKYRATGQMPPLGQGTKGAMMRAQIIHQARVLAQATGSTGAMDAANQADFKANSAALTTLQRSANQILAYERTANKNADQVLQTMGKGAATGMPVFNAWVQAGRRSIAGNPDVAAFDVAVQTFATEYARVVSGATGGAVTSDSARKEAMALINAKQTPQQLASAISQMRKDMANRRDGLNEQAATLRTLLGPKGGAPSGAPTHASKPTVSNW